MSTQDNFKPFRLMDLPAELRLMIYRRLPRQIKHTEAHYVGGLYPHSNKPIDSTVILITRHLPVAILRTSRQIHHEAYNIVAHLIRTFVTEAQPRAISHGIHLHALHFFTQCITTERKAYLVSQFSSLPQFSKLEADATLEWPTFPCARCHSATERCLEPVALRTITRHRYISWSNYTGANSWLDGLEPYHRDCSLRRHQRSGGRFDLISFHGLPSRNAHAHFFTGCFAVKRSSAESSSIQWQYHSSGRQPLHVCTCSRREVQGYARACPPEA